MTLEDTLRELAAHGEITHVSLSPRGKGWSAAFSIHARKRGPGVGAETAECSRMIDSSCFLAAYT